MKHAQLLTVLVLVGLAGAFFGYAKYVRVRAGLKNYHTRLVSNQPIHEGDSVNNVSQTGYDITPYSDDKIQELASTLDEETYRITQKAGTEAAFCGTLLDNKKEGIYTCIVCGLPMFSSEHKFDSGSGWPSFHTEFDPKHIKRISDNSMSMVRTEIQCARCTAHLGHVFGDGPPPTGERHCLNSASLVFFSNDDGLPERSQPDAKAVATETAYFAGGCFWGIEHYFQRGEGVIDAISGYMQGETDNPTYEEVCSKESGHAEAVKVIFDPEKISYEELLRAFFVMHDPTQLDRQGPDIGSQYRSGIYFTSDAQQEQAEAYIAKLTEAGQFQRPIVTEVEKAQTFWPAEEGHQDYIANTGQACHVQNPWN